MSEPSAAGGRATVTTITIAPPTRRRPATRVARALPPMVGRGGNPCVSLRSSQLQGRRFLLELPFSMVLRSRNTVEDAQEYPVRVKPQTWVGNRRRLMADTLPKEGLSARLAEIRGQLKLLSDYL